MGDSETKVENMDEVVAKESVESKDVTESADGAAMTADSETKVENIKVDEAVAKESVVSKDVTEAADGAAMPTTAVTPVAVTMNMAPTATDATHLPLRLVCNQCGKRRKLTRYTEEEIKAFHESKVALKCEVCKKRDLIANYKEVPDPSPQISGAQVVVRVNGHLYTKSENKQLRLDLIDAANNLDTETALRIAEKAKLGSNFKSNAQLLQNLIRGACLDAVKILVSCIGSSLTPHQSMEIMSSVPQAPPICVATALEIIDNLCDITYFEDKEQRSYFQTRMRWAVAEFLENGVVVFNEIKNRTIPSLVHSRQCMCPMQLANIEGDKLTFVAGGGAKFFTSAIAPGDAVYVTDCSQDVSTAIEAQVLAIGSKLIVKLQDKVQKLRWDNVKANNDTKFRVDRIANRVSFSREVASIAALSVQGVERSTAIGHLKTIMTTHSAEGSPVVADLSQRCVSGQVTMLPETIVGYLNEYQRAAVQAGVWQRVTLIQGPPGTGKTSVSAVIVNGWLRTQGVTDGKILVCSASNIAVDNILEALLNRGVRALRVGKPERTRPHLLQYCIDEMVQDFTTEFYKVSAERKKIVKSAQVICATCVGAGQTLLDGFKFTRVLIDEAAQATELACTIPLSFGCQQAVLIGDQCQLPPTVLSQTALKEGLEHSLFEKLLSHGVRPWFLSVQYRMHPLISRFPSWHFYTGNLKDGIREVDRPPVPGIPWNRADLPVCFEDVPNGFETAQGTSKVNKREAEVVVARVLSALQHGMKPQDIGIISPYSAQVNLMKDMLMSRYSDARPVEVSSVDGFQGREKTLIVISTVRANNEGKLGFLHDWRRANVAMTRARNGLYIVGNRATLQRETHSWGPWLQFAQTHGLVSVYNHRY
eukprot:m.197287 g.197287  ORF g.197287 m.197287 type:complete len:876 (+) comp15710_c1_seq8:309-2936(+)